MKRIFLLSVALMLAPTMLAAQVEIGIDGGLSIESVDDANDDVTSFSVPTSGLRVGFMGGETVVIESRVALAYTSVGDFSLTRLTLVPGVNVLLGEQFYVRGEAGLAYVSDDDDSLTQFLLGAAAGLRVPVADGVLFRAEGGFDRWLENEDEFIRASWEIRLLAGLSAVIN
ncbi:MAG: hypothetical protein R3304_04505 [Longimicrobiales bacterium]|nr:hypothetical protein [Longimicrobiales bacterium]